MIRCCVVSQLGRSTLLSAQLCLTKCPAANTVHHAVKCPAGLLANLTCIQAELYQMEQDLSLREDPLWIVPYSTVALDYQGLLADFEGYAQVGVHWLHAALLLPCCTCCQLSAKSMWTPGCPNAGLLTALCSCYAALPCEPTSPMRTNHKTEFPHIYIPQICTPTYICPMW